MPKLFVHCDIHIASPSGLHVLSSETLAILYAKWKISKVDGLIRNSYICQEITLQLLKNSPKSEKSH